MSDRRSPEPRNNRSSPSPPNHNKKISEDNVAASSQHSRQQNRKSPAGRSPSPGKKEGRTTPGSSTSSNTNTKSASATRSPSPSIKNRSGTAKRQAKKRNVEFVFDSPLLKQENGGFIKKRKARKVSRAPRNRPTPPQRQRSADGGEEGDKNGNDSNAGSEGDSNESSETESSSTKDAGIDLGNCTVGNQIIRVDNPEALEKELSAQLLSLPSPSAQTDGSGEYVGEGPSSDQKKPDMPGGLLFDEGSTSSVEEEMNRFHEPSAPQPPPPEQTKEVNSNTTAATRASRARGRGRGRSGTNGSRSPSPVTRSSPPGARSSPSGTRSPSQSPSPSPSPTKKRRVRSPSSSSGMTDSKQRSAKTSDSQRPIGEHDSVSTDTFSEPEELIYESNSEKEGQRRRKSSSSVNDDDAVSLPSLQSASQGKSLAEQRGSKPEVSDSENDRRGSETGEEFSRISFSSRESSPLDSRRSSGFASSIDSHSKIPTLSPSQKSAKKDIAKNTAQKALPQINSNRSSSTPRDSKKVTEGARSPSSGSKYAASHHSTQRSGSPLISHSSTSLHGAPALSSSANSSESIEEEARTSKVNGSQREDVVHHPNDGKMGSRSSANHSAGNDRSFLRNASETRRMQGSQNLPPPRGAPLGNRSDGAGENMRDRGEGGKGVLHPLQSAGLQHNSPSLSPLSGPGGALSTVKWAGGSPSSPSPTASREGSNLTPTRQRGQPFLPQHSNVTRTVVLRKARQENISEEAALAALTQPARLPRLGGTRAANETNHSSKSPNRRSSGNDQRRSITPRNHTSSPSSSDTVKKKVHNYNEPQEIIESTQLAESETDDFRKHPAEVDQRHPPYRNPRRNGSRSNGNPRTASPSANVKLVPLSSSSNTGGIVTDSGSGSDRRESEEDLVSASVLNELGLPRDELYKEFAEFVHWKKNQLPMSSAKEDRDGVLEPQPEMESSPEPHEQMDQETDTEERNSVEERVSSPSIPSPQKRSPKLPYPVAPVSSPEDEDVMNAIPRHLLFPSDSSCSDNSLPGISSRRSSTSSIGSPKVNGAAATIPPCKELIIANSTNPVVSTVKSGGKDGVIEAIMFGPSSSM